MGYIGNQTSNSYTSITKQDITGDGGTGYTLDHAVANAQEIEVFVNNVRQEPAVAYTVSGTALTMTGNVAASDDFYVVFQGKAVGTVVPPDDSVTTARINDGAVTNAKIDTMAASKLTGALPAIDGSSLTGIDSGVTEADQWYLTAGHYGNSTITSWARVTATGWTKIGTGMSHSSGVFTFPSTGVYKVEFQAQFRDDGSDNMAADIEVTTNNSTYTKVAQGLGGDDAGRNSGTSISYLLNVTNTSNVKVRFSADSMDTSSYLHSASSGKIRTNVMFERIAPAQS